MFGLFLSIMLAILVVMCFLMIWGKKVDFISALSFLAAVVGVGWLIYKLYKPTFTDLSFSDDGIVSKTHFERAELSLEKIKGIWYLSCKETESKYIKPYSEEADLRGCVIIFGDIDCFVNVEYVGVGGMNVVRDSFKEGYTTIQYRKSLNEMLQYYNSKIKNRGEPELQ